MTPSHLIGSEETISDNLDELREQAGAALIDAQVEDYEMEQYYTNQRAESDEELQARDDLNNARLLFHKSRLVPPARLKGYVDTKDAIQRLRLIKNGVVGVSV